MGHRRKYKSMKVLHLIDTLSFGGAQTVVKGIFEDNEDNDNITLFVLRKTETVYSINHKNVITHTGKSKYSFKPLKEIKEVIDSKGITILHCHLVRSMVFGWLVKKLYYPDSKLIFHEHGRIFTRNILYRLFIKYSKPQTDLYIAVSKAPKRYLVNYTNVPEKKIKTLYNFVDIGKFNVSSIKWNTIEERKKLGIGERDFIVGFAGRLVERKGWRTFIVAAELVLETQPNITFLIAGDGKDKHELLELINTSKLAENIVFLGYVSDMVWFYSLLNCFVIPSYWEPMGLTEIEAQAMGIPVISSDVEALNEIVRHNENGLLFTVKDEKDLAEKIQKIIVDEELRKYLINGGYQTVKTFSLKDYSIKLRGIYNELF